MLRAELSHTVAGLHLELRFDVAPGQCLALVGRSGAGKTTILRCLAGTLRPQRGRVSCAGQTWLDTERGLDWAPQRRRCGYVFQDYALFPHLSAWRNVAYGVRGVPRDARRSTALDLLERLGLEDHVDDRPAVLSGGERQRVALARALAARPAALLLDEPLSALDPSTRSRAAGELIAVLAETSVPTVLVTHDFEHAAQLGDHIAVLDGGRIVQHGSANQLAASPASAFVADFTGAVVLVGTAAPGPSGLTAVALDGGGQVLCTPSARGRVAVSVFPWEITLAPAREEARDSAQNRLATVVTSVTAMGNRVRVGLAAPQPLVAEVTAGAAEDLSLCVGLPVLAHWKATATRVSAR